MPSNVATSKFNQNRTLSRLVVHLQNATRHAVADSN